MKILIRTALFGLILGLTLFSCETSEMATQTQALTAEEIPFTSIGRGALFGGGQEGFDEVRTTLLTIRSPEDWEKLKAQMNSVNTVTGAFKDEKLDFESEMVLACIDRVRGSGGHEVLIESIVETATELEVHVIHKEPVDMAASVLTQPYHIVRVQKSGKTHILRLIEE